MRCVGVEAMTLAAKSIFPFLLSVSVIVIASESKTKPRKINCFVGDNTDFSLIKKPKVVRREIVH